ncbi:MAG: divalent-cation tolerance protein CutA [candidate division NC10 bacterium]|nr:divalent-cation tolerance protein CutA [candidate division NC10 bacterium]MBI3002454.1 divalent-cation tolerance protein CutA [candidate division NC10 bacterium]MBI4390896.1 divalent-cation tolerance protein CutA [candidate division NC10 bacterium]
MTDPAGAVIFLVTAATAIEGERIATALVEERLAACVNVVPGVISTFRWEGAVQREPEVLLIGKTRAERMPAVIARVQALHSYSIPEVLALPILAGAGPYLAWLRDATG